MLSNYIYEFAALALAHFLALLSPGPDFFLIVSSSFKRGIFSAICVSTGIALGNAVYIVLAMIGFTVLKEIPWVFLTVKLAGAVYLIFIGWILSRSRQRELLREGFFHEKTASQAGKDFMMGFLSALLNPKNSLFYLSVFTLFISTATPASVRIFYGGWMFGVVWLWDISIGLFMGNLWIRRKLNTSIHWVERGSGVMLMVFGVVLVLQ